MTFNQDLGSFDTLVAILAKLRAPDGCPWDREQTHTSLRENLLEECYEVLEALDEQDTGKLREELGDLLMQVVFHAQMAREAGDFEMADVIRSIAGKLVSRHPHVFGDVKAATSAEVLHNWEQLKRLERASGTSILSGVPGQLPALARAQAMQKRVARVGFDWPDVDGIIDKVCEELNELKQVENAAQRAEEFGDLLFTLANTALRMGVDAESALRQANEKFYRRFAAMEAVCHERGVNIGDLSFDEQNALWDEAKRQITIPDNNPSF